MQALAPVLVLFSVLFPTKLWYAPHQPISITVRSDGAVTLVLTDFLGKLIDPGSPAIVEPEQTIDLSALYPQLATPGTYLLYAVPKDRPMRDFVGTPLVISVRADDRRDARPGPMVVNIVPLCYAVVRTDKGDFSVAFYYDVAPNTVANFLNLAQGGFYDGLIVHRVVADFIVQSGDPRGDGTGGPGYVLPAEFNERPHEAGVLSMSRQTDPFEPQGAMPRAAFADSAGSQFFISLNYNRTRQFDRRYTAFGRVFEGMPVVEALGKVEVDPQTDRPLEPPIIRQVQVMPVDAAHNPYLTLIAPPATPGGAPAPAPAPAP